MQTSTWTKVYEAWKEMSSLLQRGYTHHSFEAWSIQSLDTAGKFLRLFAIKSDEERSKIDAAGPGVQLGDDFDPELEKQQQLRDCEQQLKRMFTLCLSDRYARCHGPTQGKLGKPLTETDTVARSDLLESRKWGVYAVINLLFKTYFKLNSASLARTILKALATHRGDMPPLDRFPAPQRVTFKYYEGVLFFLEENYVEVPFPRPRRHWT